jgi:tetratricopeptide (TPR) repeat protein
LRRPRAGFALGLACSAVLAAQTGNLLDRIRSSGLPATQRDQLAQLLEAKDYARMEAILEAPSAAAAAAIAAERHALAGAVQFLDGHMESAVGEFRQSDVLIPLGDPDRFTLAMALLRLSDRAGGRQQLERLLSEHPDHPLYLYWLARIDYDERLYDQSIEKLRQVIRLQPEAARAYDNLGLALDMAGQQDQALPAFQKAVALNRQLAEPSPWPPHNLGALELRLQRFNEAETALRESLRYDPALAMTHYHLGRALEGEGRDNEAIAEYRAATNTSQPVVEAFYSLALLYRRYHRDRDAQAAFAEYKKLRAQPTLP